MICSWHSLESSKQIPIDIVLAIQDTLFKILLDCEEKIYSWHGLKGPRQILTSVILAI